MINTLLAAASLANPGQVSANKALVDANPSALLKTQLVLACQTTGVPAMGAVVVKDGKVVASAFHGVRKLGTTAKVTINDLWQLGSCTKVFTKELVRKAVTLNKTAWTKTLAQAFPAWANEMHSQVKNLTLQQVADHTSGLANSYEGNPALFPPMPSLYMTRQQHVRMSLKLDPPNAPGASNYSNFGYVVLGALAEKLFGQSYEAALKTQLLTPWGVTNVFYGEPALNNPNQPWPHSFANNKISPVASCKNSLPFNTYAPAGHLSVSVAEAGELMLGYMNGGGPSRGHDGSNGRNFARISMDTGKKYGYLIMTNCGGDPGVNAVTKVQDYIKVQFPK